ncbi:MAG TPA: 50S ribosomal protein L23 [Candidatus Paceibacterota bacterium]|nr:50S ribosomal protein L23 [Candidatus Paceibacterota bacterium]
MSLFNTQRKKAGNATAGEDKLAPKAVKSKAPKEAKTKAVALPKAASINKSVAEAKAKSQNEKRAAAAQGVVFPRGSAVIKPRVTEKSGLLSQQGIYTFDVRIDATSRQISDAIAAAYKVTPVQVNVAAVPAKAMYARNKRGSTSAGKKAYVQLKKGDVIEFI